MFSLEDWFTCINEELQEIKVETFQTPIDPITRVQLDWCRQLQNAIECYNVTMEEDDQDLQNINIPKSERQ